MKTYLWLLALVLINFVAQGQTATNYSRKADSLYQLKNYPVAGSFYLYAAQVDEYKALKRIDYYNAACCYALAGKTDSALVILKLSLGYGYKDLAHLKSDADLTSLHKRAEWAALIGSVKEVAATTNDPYKAKLITTDVKNFWTAYDKAKKDTAHRYDIYKKYYLDAGTEGLQDYFAYKVRNLRDFVAVHDKKPKFYAAIRANTLSVDDKKPLIINSFAKLKQIYPDASFPDIYFVIGAFTSGGTSTSTGLLIGLDQSARTADIPLGELTLWQRNNFNPLNDLPNLVAHELIHFNQAGMAADTTLLRAVLVEGMADFIGELISGGTPNSRLHVWAMGKEKQIWADFKKEMYLRRAQNWIANSDQETATKPADIGYWVGYQICKAYYNNSADKNKAVYDMLNIKDYRKFYEQSNADNLFK